MGVRFASKQQFDHFPFEKNTEKGTCHLYEAMI